MSNSTSKFRYCQLDSSKLTSDPSYQRQVDNNRVKRIVSSFNPKLVNPIKVSLRGGKYYVFDGQHTLVALKMKNGGRDLLVECKVYTGLTQKEEARLFVAQNGLSRAVDSNARMKALYTAGDVDVMELCDTLDAMDVKFDFTRGRAKYKIVACAMVYKIFQKTSPAEFADIIDIIKRAWGGDPESFRKEILGGMYVFCTTYSGQYNSKKAITQFSKISPQEIIRNGKVFTTGGDTRFAVQLLNAYNKGLRGPKLAEFHLSGIRGE